MASGGFSIRFNAAALKDEEDDEEDIYSRSPKHIEAVSFEIASPVLSDLEKSSDSSKEEPISIKSNNSSVLRSSPGKYDIESSSAPEKSLLSGWREKLQEKIPEHISAFIEKKLEQNQLESDLLKERRMRKGNSFQDEKQLHSGNSSEGSDFGNQGSGSFTLEHHRSGSFDGDRMSHSPSPSSEVTTPIASDNYHIAKSCSFQVVEDFYTEDLNEDFSEKVQDHNLERSNSEKSHAKRSNVKKFIGTEKFATNKEKADRPHTMTLSSILSSKKGVVEEYQNLASTQSSDQFIMPKIEKQSKPVLNQGDMDNIIPVSEPKPKGLPSKHHYISALVGFLACLLAPLPPYLGGVMLGLFISSIAFYIYQWLMVPTYVPSTFLLPDVKLLPPMQTLKNTTTRNDTKVFKAWMNYLQHYDPENYHINETQSIFVQLEQTTLRIQRPKNKLPKRALSGESLGVPSFIEQKHIDLKGAKVYLQPEGLVKKRLWSKKYPICVAVKTEAILKLRSPCTTPAKTPVSPTKSTFSDEGINFVDKGFEMPSNESKPVNDNKNDDKKGIKVLYLFTRTSREKEAWYRRLVGASEDTPLPVSLNELKKLNSNPSSSLVKRHSMPSFENVTKSKGNEGSAIHSMANTPISTEPELMKDDANEIVEVKELSPAEILSEYMHYMARVMPPGESPSTPSPTSLITPRHICEPHAAWLNAFIARCSWDFLRESPWADRVMDKVQKKLSKIHVPYFIDTLTVTDIEMGQEMPVIRRLSQPYIDEQGLWMDMDIAYSGGFRMTLETKVNLMKLKKKDSDLETLDVPEEGQDTTIEEKRSPVLHSEEEDSAESSTDEDSCDVDDKSDTIDDIGIAGTTAQSGSKSKKLLRLVDKITASKYFQQAAENKYIKRAMEGVSNTRLVLTVELHSLTGTLAVNIPPPPSDRVWFGFRHKPKLWLAAKPKVGERQVTVTQVTEWIEKKLFLEFQRVFVMPNMDDLPIPLLSDKLPTNVFS